MKNCYSIFTSLLFFCFASTYPAFLLAQTTTAYTYDELGRLTFVTDPNGNRDYDYDKVGNRTEVAEGTPGEGGFGPPLPAPYVQSSGCSTAGPGAYRGNWSAVPGAVGYLYRTNAGNEYRVYGLQSEVYTSKCSWVRACSATSLASCNGIKANFQ